MGLGNWISTHILGQNPAKITAPTIDASQFQMPNTAQSQQQLAQLMAQTQGQQAPVAQAAQLGPMQQAAAPDLSAQNVTAGQQTQLGQALYNQAMGLGGPSVAQQQLQHGLQQNIAGQMAQAGSMAGFGNPSLIGRQLQNNLAGAQLQTNQQAGLQRAQEQFNAQQNLSGLLGQQRQGDLTAADLSQNNAQFNANQQNTGTLNQGLFNQQTGIANQTAQIQSQQLKNNMIQYLLGQGLDINSANQQAQILLQQMLSGNAMNAQYGNAQIQGNNASSASKFYGGLINSVMSKLEPSLGSIMNGDKTSNGNMIDYGSSEMNGALGDFGGAEMGAGLGGSSGMGGLASMATMIG